MSSQEYRRVTFIDALSYAWNVYGKPGPGRHPAAVPEAAIAWHVVSPRPV
jgi:hypothetical protein